MVRIFKKYFLELLTVFVWLIVFAFVGLYLKDFREQKQSKQQFSKIEKLAYEIEKNPNFNSTLTSEEIIVKIVEKTNFWEVDTCFVIALIENETAYTFNEKIKARDYKKTKSVGWSQMTKDTLDWFNNQYVYPTHQENWREEDLLNPDKALDAICWYLTKIQKMSNPDIRDYRDLYYYYNCGANSKSPYSDNANKTALKNAEKVKKIYLKYLSCLE